MRTDTVTFRVCALWTTSLTLLFGSLTAARAQSPAPVPVPVPQHSQPASVDIPNADQLGPQISRDTVLSRAAYWVGNSKIVYSSTTTYSGPDGIKYRGDCSGFVSMALKLPAPGPSTVDLINDVTSVSSPGDMKPGDLLGVLGDGTGGENGHVQVFKKWLNSSYSRVEVLEQGSDGNNPHDYPSDDIYSWPEPAIGGRPFKMYRYKNITDSPSTSVTNGGSFVRVGGTYHGVQVAANGHVSQLVWDGSKWYRQDLGGNAAGTAAIVYHDGSYNVFALSPSGDLYQDRYDSGGSGWTGFYRDGSVTFTARSGVSAIYADGEYRVFGIGPGGHVFQSFYSDAWHSQDLGGSAVGTPGVTYVNGRYDVFVVGPSGALYQDRYDAGGSGWTGFYGTSGVTFAKTGGVSAVYADGAYRVYGVGPSGDVYQSYYSDGWHSQDLGGTAVGTPSITYADGRYDLYATTAANNVFQDTYTNSWTGWHQIASAP